MYCICMYITPTANYTVVLGHVNTAQTIAEVLTSGPASLHVPALTGRTQPPWFQNAALISIEGARCRVAGI